MEECRSLVLSPSVGGVLLRASSGARLGMVSVSIYFRAGFSASPVICARDLLQERSLLLYMGSMDFAEACERASRERASRERPLRPPRDFNERAPAAEARVAELAREAEDMRRTGCTSESRSCSNCACTKVESLLNLGSGLVQASEMCAGKPVASSGSTNVCHLQRKIAARASLRFAMRRIAWPQAMSAFPEAVVTEPTCVGAYEERASLREETAEKECSSRRAISMPRMAATRAETT